MEPIDSGFSVAPDLPHSFPAELNCSVAAKAIHSEFFFVSVTNDRARWGRQIIVLTS